MRPIDVSGGFGRTLAPETAPPSDAAQEFILVLPQAPQEDRDAFVAATIITTEVYESDSADAAQTDLYIAPVIDPDPGHGVESHSDAVHEERIGAPMQVRREVSFGSRIRPHFQVEL